MFPKDLNLRSANNFAGTFEQCFSLQNLDAFSSVIVDDVQKMNKMFSHCYELKSVDLHGFNIRNVRSLESVFEKCAKLCDLNIENFCTENVEDMSSMFENCHNLKAIKLDNFNTKSLRKMNKMFKLNNRLEELFLFHDAPNLIEVNSLFDEDSNLKKIVFKTKCINEVSKLLIDEIKKQFDLLYSEGNNYIQLEKKSHHLMNGKLEFFDL